MGHAEDGFARSKIDALLPYARAKAAAYQSDASVGVAISHLRRIAAATVFRVPRCLKAVLLLADAKLSLEANTICRTLLELAIESSYVGTSEERAGRVWNSFVLNQHRGLIKYGTFTGMMKPVSDVHREQLRELRRYVRPDLAACAESAIDIDGYPARKIAQSLYNLYYDSLSASAHGDLRDAVSIVQWQKEDALLDEALDTALLASIAVLCVASLQLGFRNDLQGFLDSQDLWNPFSQ